MKRFDEFISESDRIDTSTINRAIEDAFVKDLTEIFGDRVYRMGVEMDQEKRTFWTSYTISVEEQQGTAKETMFEIGKDIKDEMYDINFNIELQKHSVNVMEKSLAYFEKIGKVSKDIEVGWDGMARSININLQSADIVKLFKGKIRNEYISMLGIDKYNL